MPVVVYAVFLSFGYGVVACSQVALTSVDFCSSWMNGWISLSMQIGRLT